MRSTFVDDATLSPRLFDLLDTVFPGARQIARNAAALGASWESVSTPFVRVEGEHVIAHVSVIELSLVVLGRTITVGAIHGVVTRPDARRRGCYRALMEEGLDYCAGRYQTLILTTEHPEYFFPFGFRVVTEHVFTWKGHSTGDRGFRLLDPARTEDARLLLRLLDTRTAVSEVVGVVNDKAVFCFNEGSRPLHYAPDLDVVVCLAIEGTRLTLFDIVGTHIPPLARLLAQVPGRVDEVAICFSAERLGVEAQASPHVLDHECCKCRSVCPDRSCPPACSGDRYAGVPVTVPS